MTFGLWFEGIWLPKEVKELTHSYSKDPIFVGGKDALNLDFSSIFEDQYPDAAYDIYTKVPDPIIDELEITAFIDYDHAHDKLTRISITGLLILLGRTPVYFMIKCQGSIDTSTYGE